MHVTTLLLEDCYTYLWPVSHVLSCAVDAYNKINLTVFRANLSDCADLALGRQFEASSTCGQIEPAEYCYSESNGVLVSIDNCYVCDASLPQFSRGVENLNDDDSQLQPGDSLDMIPTDNNLTERTWWQSADLERENEIVTVELKFEQEFEVFQTTVDFRSLRPASASLEVSTDFGSSYKPIQYYSDKCLEDFGVESDESVVNDEAGCTSNYTDPSPGPVRLLLRLAYV